ncbi:MAG: capsule assembly Wzi family protein [Pseudomonadota bacterium]
MIKLVFLRLSAEVRKTFTQTNFFKSKLYISFIALLIIALPFPALSETSVNVNIDSWVYPALERLASLRLIESGLINTKPLTRKEVARLINEAMSLEAEGETGQEVDNTTLFLLKKLKKEFKDELNNLGTIDDFKSKSFIKPINEFKIGYHLLDGNYTIYNNDGIRYGDNHNASLEVSGYSDLFNTISLYYQPILEYNQNLDDEENTTVNLKKGYAKLNLSNVEFEIGRDSMWWGPGYHGSLLMTNNAEPFDMLKISNPRPILLPWIFRYLGPFKVTLMLSKLEKDRPIPEPYLYGLRLNIKPLPTLEMGLSHIAIFGGEGRELSFTETLEVLYSNRNLSGKQESNQQFAFDFSFWVHDINHKTKLLRSIKFYAEIGAEDTGYPPDHRAHLVGLLFKDLFLTGKTDLRIEYVHTSPGQGPDFWYFHSYYPAFYIGRVFGHHVGSNAQNIFARVTSYLNNNLIAGIDIDMETRGLSKTVQEKRYQFGVDVSYNVTDMIEIRGRYGFERVNNLNFVDGVEKDYHFFGGELITRF